MSIARKKSRKTKKLRLLMFYFQTLHILSLILSFVLLPSALADTAPIVKPTNVIIMIGDGMGFEHLAATEAYLGRRLIFNNLEHFGEVTTQNANGGITDSAAAGTAIATGQKVNNGVISVSSPGDNSEVQTLLEYYKLKGRSTALVTTAFMTDATPAAFGAHEQSRSHTTQIASDMLTQSKPNIILGGGGNGMSAVSATASGYTVVEDKASLIALDSMAISFLSGQFGSSNLPYQYDGLGNMPELSDMTEKALSILETNENGFFLMIEGGLIDKAAHGNDIARVILEIVEFEDSVQKVLNWANTRQDTLVIITADHETGGLDYLQSNGQAQIPSVSWSSSGHTAANVPIYAYGYGAQRISGTIDNTDIFGIVTNPDDCDQQSMLSDFDQDLISDCSDLDDDNDNASDIQEELDGTNPFDRGSFLPMLENSVCSDWNGFLDGMWNIMEHINLSSFQLDIRTTLYDPSRVCAESLDSTIKSGGQADILIHDFQGWQRNSYGKVCSAISSQQVGRMDGSMIYYKPSTHDNSVQSFDFVFAMPFNSGLTGSQFVLYNTFQPSFNLSELSNNVSNWIQLSNLSEQSASGELIFYDQDGLVLKNQRITLGGGARQDISAHQFGSNHYGLIEWRPETLDTKFQLRNVRYFYNNPYWQNSFVAALQLEGDVGSISTLISILDSEEDSSIIELANTSSNLQNITVQIFNNFGTLLQTYNINLSSYSTQHFITDSILNRGKGIALIKGSENGGVIASVLQYGKKTNGGIQYAYAIGVDEALGSILKGSYNTYLNQGCRLRLANPSNQNRVANLTLTREDGTILLSDNNQTVPSHGLLDLDICSFEDTSNYGVISVTLEDQNSLYGSIIRIGENNKYRFATKLRQ